MLSGVRIPSHGSQAGLVTDGLAVLVRTDLEADDRWIFERSQKMQRIFQVFAMHMLMCISMHDVHVTYHMQIIHYYKLIPLPYTTSNCITFK